MDSNTGKIMSHKEWSTGKKEVKFEEKELKKALPVGIKLKEIPSDGDYVYIHHTMPETTIITNENTIVGKGDFWVTNNTSMNQTYKSHTVLCIGNDNADGEYITNSCTYSESVFTLYPKTGYGVTVYPQLLTKEIRSGSYMAAIYSEIKRDDQQTVFASNAYGKITINN